MSIFFDFEQKESVLCIRIGGELDHHSTEELRAKITTLITKKNVNKVIFNFESLNFMDSSGLGLLLGRYNEINSLNGEMVVCSANETISKILEMSGVHKIIRLEQTEEIALNSLGVA